MYIAGRKSLQVLYCALRQQLRLHRLALGNCQATVVMLPGTYNLRHAAHFSQIALRRQRSASSVMKFPWARRGLTKLHSTEVDVENGVHCPLAYVLLCRLLSMSYVRSSSTLPQCSQAQPARPMQHRKQQCNTAFQHSEAKKRASSPCVKRQHARHLNTWGHSAQHPARHHSFLLLLQRTSCKYSADALWL